MVISISKRVEPVDDREPAVSVTPAVFQILLALARGKSHGYGIMQDTARVTRDDARLGPGTLYRSIQRMLVDGLIEERALALHDEEDDDRRRYYRLTAKGRSVAKQEAQRLSDLVDIARERGLIPRRTSRGVRP